MIYKGSQKEGKVYIGGTKIGKIYKGSQLVYQSQKSLRLYSYGINTGALCGMIGGFTTSFPYFQGTSNGEYYSTLTTINGTIGQPGSSISRGGQSTTYGYNSSHWVNGILLHFYLGGTGVWRGHWVFDGSTLGSTVLYCHYNNTDYTLGYPITANESTITYPLINTITTSYRDSSQDKTWTINGIY